MPACSPPPPACLLPPFLPSAGEATITVEGLIVWKIDVRRQLMYLKGAVPGKAGA